MDPRENVETYTTRVTHMFRIYEETSRDVCRLQEELKEAKEARSEVSNVPGRPRQGMAVRVQTLREKFEASVAFWEGILRNAGHFLEKFQNDQCFANMKRSSQGGGAWVVTLPVKIVLPQGGVSSSNETPPSSAAPPGSVALPSVNTSGNNITLPSTVAPPGGGVEPSNVTSSKESGDASSGSVPPSNGGVPLTGDPASSVQPNREESGRSFTCNMEDSGEGESGLLRKPAEGESGAGESENCSLRPGQVALSNSGLEDMCGQGMSGWSSDEEYESIGGLQMAIKQQKSPMDLTRFSFGDDEAPEEEKKKRRKGRPRLHGRRSPLKKHESVNECMEKSYQVMDCRRDM
ncbi:uncharacterized protein [Phyllobates terribilis]|uniref:uncharacterized protein isoform X2 n=1 Tax=Phyllobates terribilis TaxID=111132 RepID=UPI003CCA80EC